MSSFPMVHVAILRSSRLVATLGEVGTLFEALDRQGLPEDSPSNLGSVSGPNGTADTEMSLTRGVHGPKRVDVIALA